jgi:hypothetical protein
MHSSLAYNYDSIDRSATTDVASLVPGPECLQPPDSLTRNPGTPIHELNCSGCVQSAHSLGHDHQLRLKLWKASNVSSRVSNSIFPHRIDELFAVVLSSTAL